MGTGSHYCNIRGARHAENHGGVQKPTGLGYIYESLDVLDRGAARAQGDGGEVLIVR